MYQKIVVAVDGSESSKRALDEAVRIAALTHGEVHAVNLVEKAPVFPYTCHYDTATMNHNVRRRSLAMLNEAAHAMAAAGINGETELIEIDGMTDDIARCLQRCEHDYGAELVVMGTHGYRGVRRAVQAASPRNSFVYRRAQSCWCGRVIVDVDPGSQQCLAQCGDACVHV
jgi:nucleotide-binding universal stress UspA family protein